MTNLLSCKISAIILALIVFYPTNVISREVTARTALIVVVSTVFCLKEEGIITDQEAFEYAMDMLEEDGISREKIMKLMQSDYTGEAMDSYIRESGGCVQIGKDVEKHINSKSTKTPK